MKPGRHGWWALVLAFGACSGHAEVLRRDRAGGILALKGVRDKAMLDADRQMKTHCQGPYSILLEENAIIGQQTQSSESYQSHATNAAVVTTGVREYQVTYACGAAPNEPPSASAQSPAAIPAAAGGALAAPTVSAGEAAAGSSKLDPSARPIEYAPAPASSLTTTASVPAGHEGLVLGVRGMAAALVGGASESYNLGFGFGLLLGYELRFDLLSLTPEFSVQWQQFTQKMDLGPYASGEDRTYLGIQPGANVALNLGNFRPWLAAHVGFAHRDGCLYESNCATNGVGFDAGIGGDVTIGRTLSLGPFMSANFASIDGANTWLTFGLSSSGRF
jgi:hypothetical protein